VDPGIVFLGVAFLLMVVVFRRGNRQRRDLAQLQDRLAPGAEVMTASGLYGTIVEVLDDRVSLQTGPGQVSTWDRRAIARVLTPASTTDSASSSTTDPQTRTASDTTTEPAGGEEPGPPSGSSPF
jgi:preprotein translocase subunit YajC